MSQFPFRLSCQTMRSPSMAGASWSPLAVQTVADGAAREASRVDIPVPVPVVLPDHPVAGELRVRLVAGRHEPRDAHGVRLREVGGVEVPVPAPVVGPDDAGPVDGRRHLVAGVVREGDGSMPRWELYQ